MPPADDPDIVAFQVALGRAIRAARKDRNLGVEKLALASGVHRTHIASLERGQLNIRIGTLLKLADGLGIAPDELLRRSRDELARADDDRESGQAGPAG